MWLITYLVPKQTDRYLSAFDLVFITKVGKKDPITFFSFNIYAEKNIILKKWKKTSYQILGNWDDLKFNLQIEIYFTRPKVKQLSS